jgi:hypothetical protein
MNAKTFGLMKNGAYFINTAQSILDEFEGTNPPPGLC